ncbi:MFS transporter [Castellaniella hirudinis]|uniref:MFS transporter n=1 Tax=Castellaniella hirudinis TaxID=1144617 RepID=UPI0039C209A0
MAVADAAPVQAPAAWTLQGLLTVVFLGVAAGLQLVDIGVQAVSLSAIQRSFQVSDTAIGALQGLAGVLVGSALAIPLARFGDQFSRKRMLLCLIAASSALMAISGLAPNFPVFFLGRSTAGIAEFAMVPLVYSMIPDLAPERHRVAANLGFAALMAAGASGGFYFSGAILAAADAVYAGPLEPWRKGFLLLSLAGLPLLLLGLATADPARRAGAAAAAAGASLRHFLSRQRRAIGLFVGVAGCLMIAVQALNQLLTLALERRFSADPAAIGYAIGIIILVTSVGCLPVAGLLDRWLGRAFGQAVRPLIMGLSVLLALPAMLLMAMVQTLDWALVVAGGFLFMTCTANALVPTMLQDLAPAPLRARVFALWSFVVSVFSATGPLLAGMVSDYWFSQRLLDAIVAVAVPALALSAVCAAGAFRQGRAAGRPLAGA